MQLNEEKFHYQNIHIYQFKNINRNTRIYKRTFYFYK